MLLILIQVILRQILILHFLNQVLPGKLLLTERGHIEIHWEFTVIVNFNFLKGVEVKLKSFEDQEQSVGHSLDRASLESAHFLLALLTVVGVVSLKHFSLDVELQTLFH
jgi:hypothetical protein